MSAGMLSGDMRLAFHLWVGKIPRRRAHGNPFQHSCLENPIDRVAWRVTKSQTLLNRLSTHTHTAAKNQWEWARGHQLSLRRPVNFLDKFKSSNDKH